MTEEELRLYVSTNGPINGVLGQDDFLDNTETVRLNNTIIKSIKGLSVNDFTGEVLIIADAIINRECIEKKWKNQVL